MTDHGTISRYTNNRCRCQRCRNANTAYGYHLRSINGTLGRHGPRLPRHGTRVEYIKHRCRCQPCRNAEATYRATYRKLKP